MNQVLAAAVVAAMAVFLAVPRPSEALRRLRPLDARPLPGWLRGREGATPLRQRAAVGVAAGVVLVLLLDGAVGLAAGLSVGLGLMVALGQRGARPDTRALAAQLPDALVFLSVCLEAGQPMPRSVAAVAEVSPQQTARLLGEVASQMALGSAGPEAWERLRTHPVWGRAASDIARAERSGSSLTGVLRMHAEDARQEVRDQRLKAARTVGVRSVVPLMVCFLPAFILIGVVPIVAGLLQNFFSG